MTEKDIIRSRLINHQIAYTQCREPVEIVSLLAAMQAQEYPMAKWAIGLRLPGITNARIEEDFNLGLILRTHMLRPTWHFVAPVDIRWIQSLTSPTVHAFNAYYYRLAELDAKLFMRAMKLLQKMLEGKNFLSRTRIQVLLEKNKIMARGLRFGLILMFAELEGLICSGPRTGKQLTYALLEERSDIASAYRPTDPLAELTNKYFSTRGPATARDFMWWSGLKARQVREGIESLPGSFEKETLNEREYIFLPLEAKPKAPMQSSFLLPDYDEYGISYKNRDAYAVKNDKELFRKLNPTYKHYLVIKGKISGRWKRVVTKGIMSADAICLPGVGKNGQLAIRKAIDRYNRFQNPERAKK